jgi:hypothetical protein
MSKSALSQTRRHTHGKPRSRSKSSEPISGQSSQTVPVSTLLREHAGCLHHAPIPATQRQVWAKRIGRVIGNRHLDQLIQRGDPETATETAVAPRLPPGVPDWLPELYARSGAVTREEAVTMIAGVGAFAVQQLMRCFEAAATPADARRVHLAGGRRAHMLDWDSVHRQISPASPPGTTVTQQYGSLRRVFYQHRQAQLETIFGVNNPDFVISAARIADQAGRLDVGAAVRASLFRANQHAIVETLNVSTSSRYAREPGKTFCNIYAYDFVTAMGGYLPRVWWKPAVWRQIQNGAEIVSHEELRRLRAEGESTENVVAPIYGQTVTEQNANALNRWMRTTGADFGWREETNMNAAQAAANSGQVVIILAANVQASRSGHVTVVLAESAEHRARRNDEGQVIVPLQSQAGSSNFKYGGQNQWWSNRSHREGAAWIFEGAIRSPLITPEEMGAAP